MASATLAETTKDRLERQRGKLLTRRLELEEALEAFPGSIAIQREKWIHSESPSDETKLKRLQKQQYDTEAELLETIASLNIVDELLAAELAKEAEERAAEIRIEGDRRAQEQAEAVAEFASAFAELFVKHYPRYADATAQVGQFYAVNRNVIGDRALHVLDPLPCTSKRWSKSAIRRWFVSGRGPVG